MDGRKRKNDGKKWQEVESNKMENPVIRMERTFGYNMGGRGEVFTMLTY